VDFALFTVYVGGGGWLKTSYGGRSWLKTSKNRPYMTSENRHIGRRVSKIAPKTVI